MEPRYIKTFFTFLAAYAAANGSPLLNSRLIIF